MRLLEGIVPEEAIAMIVSVRCIGGFRFFGAAKVRFGGTPVVVPPGEHEFLFFGPFASVQGPLI